MGGVPAGAVPGEGLRRRRRAGGIVAAGWGIQQARAVRRVAVAGTGESADQLTARDDRRIHRGSIRRRGSSRSGDRNERSYWGNSPRQSGPERSLGGGELSCGAAAYRGGVAGV